MKLKLFFIIIPLIFLSCSDNLNITPDKVSSSDKTYFESKDIFKYLSETTEQVTFKGTSDLFPKEIFSGSYLINEDKTLASGELHINDELSQNFVVNITPESLQKISVGKSKNGILYKNVFDNDELVEVSNLEETDEVIKGQLNYRTINLEFEIQKVDLGNAQEKIGPLVVWGIITGITTVTTVVTCAYERTAARNACQYLYSQCIDNCNGPCQYHYTSGMCGGTCEIECNE